MDEDPIAEALQSVARAVKYLGAGDNADQRGAVEFLAESVKEGLSEVASAIHDLATAIREHDKCGS